MSAPTQFDPQIPCPWCGYEIREIIPVNTDKVRCPACAGWFERTPPEPKFEYPILDESNYLSMWILFDHPDDYPDHFVARRRLILPGNDLAMPEAYLSASLDALRNHFSAQGLSRMMRDPEDAPKIIEIWF